MAWQRRWIRYFLLSTVVGWGLMLVSVGGMEIGRNNWWGVGAVYAGWMVVVAVWAWEAGPSRKR